ncbi:MAG: GNAT family N-acetyltransferase [Candidatus Zixiibacteriota bacterium]
MKKPVEYRALQPENYDDMIRLWTEAQLHIRTKGRDSRAKVLAEMKRNPDYLIGAFDGNELVGVVVGTYDGRRGCVNRLAVAKSHRKLGIAQELSQRCEARLRVDGAMVVYALIEVENLPSQTLFKKMGYHYHDGLMYFSKRKSDED